MPWAGNTVDTQDIMSPVGSRPEPCPAAALNLDSNVHQNISKQAAEVESDASGAISTLSGVSLLSGERAGLPPVSRLAN